MAYLHRQGYAVSTIMTHMAGIGYIHKLNGWKDPTTSFVMKGLVNAVKKEAPRTLAKLPITLHMLYDLISSSEHILTSRYDKVMYKALLLLQYHACARVGELVVSGQNTENVVQLNQISFQSDSLGTVTQLIIDFMYFKHNKAAQSEAVTINATDEPSCPVQAVRDYIQARGQAPGFLFVNAAGMPVQRNAVSRMLKRFLTASGYRAERYDTHGLRIGRASQAAQDGWTETQIKHLGRWKSEAYKQYIRRPAVS